MTLTKSLIAVITISMVIALGAQTSIAKTDSTSNTQIISWSFTAQTQNHIEDGLNRGTRTFGLSTSKQKRLERYGVTVGTVFFTTINNKYFVVKRTSSGFVVLGEAKTVNPANLQEAPIQVTGSTRSASINAAPETVWNFDDKISDKLLSRLSDGHKILLVGLNTAEQKMLEDYGIKVGDTFVANFCGGQYHFKRTSMGIEVNMETHGAVSQA